MEFCFFFLEQLWRHSLFAVLLAASWLGTLPAHGREIPLGTARDMEETLARAREEGYLVVLVLLRSKDPEDREAIQALQDPRVSDLLAPFPVLAISSRRYPSVPARFGEDRYPVVLFIDPQAAVLGRIRGAVTPEKLAESAAELISVAREAGAFRAPPDYPSSLLAKARLAWWRGETFRAVSLFEKALGEAGGPPGKPEKRLLVLAHFHLGEHYRKANRPAEAERHYREALEAATEPASSGQEQPEPAGDSSFPRRKKTEIERYCALAALGLAFSIRRQGRLEEAVQFLQSPRALESREHLQEKLPFLLGSLYLEMGRQAAARKSFQECRDLWPRTRLGLRAARFLEAEDGRPTEVPSDKPESE